MILLWLAIWATMLANPEWFVPMIVVAILTVVVAYLFDW